MTTSVAPELVRRSLALRERLRPEGGPLASASIGTVPILWNNVDIEELRLGTKPEMILDEIARLGYDGCQFGLGFPEGADLVEALATRNLRLAEVYASIGATQDGPAAGALEAALARLRLLVEGGGEVLCVALDLSPGRLDRAGRAGDPGTPRLSDEGWQRLAAVLYELARAATSAGRRLAFHPHAGTFIETPAETERLLETTDPGLVPLCMDVGHWIVGGGDPVAALRRYGERISHVHFKDVDPIVLGQLRRGELASFKEAIRARLFTELGAGQLDLLGCLRVLAARRYEGWMMVEQDSSWSPPSEAAAIGRRVLAESLAIVDGERAG